MQYLNIYFTSNNAYYNERNWFMLLIECVTHQVALIHAVNVWTNHGEVFFALWGGRHGHVHGRP